MALAEAPKSPSPDDDPRSVDRAALLEGLDERVAVSAGARNVADASLCSLMADVLSCGAWDMSGIHSETHWITWQFGVSFSRAKQLLRIAKRWAELPHAVRRFEAGLLSFDQVSIIARLCPTGFDDGVSEFAESATLTQLNTNLRRYEFDFDTAEAEPPPERQPTNKVSRGFGDDGRYRLSLDADAATGALIDSSINQAFDRLMSEALASGAEDPATAVTTFDAVVDIVATSSAADPSDSRRHRFQPLLHIDVDNLIERGAENLTGRLHLGPTLTDKLTALALCDSAPAVVACMGGVPLAKGRATEKIPPALRSLVQHRDGGCRVCGSTRNLQVHHITHWANGGSTDPHNLVTLCHRHHVLVHQGTMDVQGDPTKLDDVDALRIIDRHGRRCRPPTPQPAKPPDPSSDDELPLYRHPLGERFDRRWLDFNPNQPNPPNRN